MFNTVMMPVDLSVPETHEKALAVACDLARRYEAGLCLVSVAGGLSAKVSNSPSIYAEKLAAFAAAIAEREGVEIATKVYETDDPSVEVDAILVRAVDEVGADLIVMATHKPGWWEYIVNSHGGRVAAHASVSVMLVR